ncbi:MAG: aminotransferase class I/II-fold pyridoxal phosphate-dependent enzyme, partial [Candidatus Latescibacteria bacterium]|nr:aminotransferase class I/II-fold pyridoxal phosphate-dependent enzyme [Candidatus Latescibacterota bacterium]
VALPVFQSATFEYAGQNSYHDLKYIRLNNTPNHQVLHAKLAAIAGGEAAVVAASGMAAITSALLSFLRSGDHLLVQDCLYGGTHTFVNHDLPSLGIAFDFVAGNDPSSWESLLKPETRVIYVETMTNPLLEVTDLEAVVRFAREHNLVSMIDNTFASPVNFKPLGMGFDVELHSCTKYLNGHSDIVAGCAIGGEDRIERIVDRMNHLGGCLDPHACFLLYRGMKTLALRVRHQNDNALGLSQLLEGHPAVAQVNYPGLDDHPQHARAELLFEGCGGVLSFEVRGGVEAADRLIESLVLPISAPSLGGVETLITRPATTSHSGMTTKERAQAGISDGLIRVAVGIEAADDLCDDFEQALARL